MTDLLIDRYRRTLAVYGIVQWRMGRVLSFLVSRDIHYLLVYSLGSRC